MMEKKLLGARIKKIAQPENDALLITFKAEDRTTPRLYLSASASLPLIYFTDENKPSPLTAPNFCMLLRKYISGGRVSNVSQPGLERIIRIDLEHLDELGDPSSKTLVIELMGKHSNIIFLNSDGMILDSIKHVTAQMSSVREVFPGREYFVPEQTGKRSLFDSDKDDIVKVVSASPAPVAKAVYGGFTGISPLVANELCYRANVDADSSCASLDEAQLSRLADEMLKLVGCITKKEFFPSIVFEGEKPLEFSSIKLNMYSDLREERFDDISVLLRTYYEKKDIYTRIRQKSSDLRKIISLHIQRSAKKYDLQLKQLKDTEKMDKYRIYGELINTYGYQSSEGDKSLTALNYYTNEEITIPLDPTLSPAKNAQKYFDRYNKLKRTKEAVATQLEETEKAIHLLIDDSRTFIVPDVVFCEMVHILSKNIGYPRSQVVEEITRALSAFFNLNYDLRIVTDVFHDYLSNPAISFDSVNKKQPAAKLVSIPGHFPDSVQLLIRGMECSLFFNRHSIKYSVYIRYTCICKLIFYTVQNIGKHQISPFEEKDINIKFCCVSKSLHSS